MSIKIAIVTALFSTTHLRGLRLTAMQSMAYASPTAEISSSLFKLSVTAPVFAEDWRRTRDKPKFALKEAGFLLRRRG
jgi:hypothetical protein